LNKIIQSKPKYSITEARSILKSYFEKDNSSSWKSDQMVYNWLLTSERDILNRLEGEYLIPGQIEMIKSILNRSPKDSVSIISSVIESLSMDQRKELISKIQIPQNI